jgi:SAM-dependent methyltransferase
MTGSNKHDAWTAGDSYEAYMGRWSRKVAPPFLDWLGAGENLDWLDVGCGTGALSSAILSRCNPRSLIGIEPSDGFVATARRNVSDGRAAFEAGNAQALRLGDHTRDVVASALVLNFVPDIPLALSEMKRVARPGGTVAFYVWDYPGGGIEFMRAFWQAAVALDPKAADLGEGKRFPFCTPERLGELAANAGLAAIECRALEVETVFEDFEDYWHPFTLGAGPAPGYCVSLAEDARQRLRQRLEDDLPRRRDGAIALKARAWGIKALAG